MKILNKKIIFLILIQLLSLFSTHMTSFAIGLYFYQKSGSLFEYSLFSIFIIAPEILLSPIIGVYVDKYNKKILMLIGHAGAGVASIFLFFLFYMDYQNTYVILLIVAISSVFNSLVFLSFNTLIGSQVNNDKMHVFASIIQFGFSFIIIFAPAISAMLLESEGITYIIYIDISTFSLALITIYILKFNVHNNNKTFNTKNYFFNGIKDSIISLKNNTLLLLNLILFIFLNFSMSIVSINLVPLVLNIGTVSSLGTVMSIAGCGLVTGSVIMMFFITKQYNYWMNRFAFFQASILFLAIIDLNLILISIGSFLFMLFSSLIGILNYTYWQNEIKQELKGRLFGLRNSIMGLSLILGYILSAPISQGLMKMLLDKIVLFQYMVGNNSFSKIKLLFILLSIFILLLILIIEYYRVKINKGNLKNENI